MLLRAALPLAIAAALSAGCPGPGGPVTPPIVAYDGGPCVQGLVGVAGASIELEPFAIVNGQAKVLHDGDSVPLVVPGQGGYIAYAGARARNLMGCNATLTAQFLDPDTGQAATGLSGRTVNFVEPEDGYWQARSDDLEFESPNIPACPDQLGKGVAARSLLLQISVVDAAGRFDRISLKVIPQCPAGDLHCACICGPNYKSGGC